MSSLSTPNMLELFVRKARQLYTLPAVAAKVLELTECPHVDVRKLKTCIEQDPSLATKLLGVVNSSLFGLSRRVSDLNQALALLGVKPLKLLVLGFSLPKGLMEGVEADALAAFWRHALTKSVAAKEIAVRFWKMSGDEAFLAGLLQDVGVLVLTQDLGEPYVQLRQRALCEGADVSAWESSALGFTHLSLSAELLDHWRLPKEVVRPVAVEHDSRQIEALPVGERTLPQILHLAELMARIMAEQPRSSLAELLEIGSRYRDLTVDDVVDLFVDLEPKIQQLGDVLSVPLPNDDEYTAIIERAHRQLAATADDTARQLLRGGLPEPSEVDEVRRLHSAAVSVAAAPVTQPGEPQPNAASSKTPASVVPAQPGARVIDDPGLVGRIRSAVASARQARAPLSLLMVEMDSLDDLALECGVERLAHLQRVVEGALTALCHPRGGAILIADGRWGLVVDDCDRPQAVDLARHIVGPLPNDVAVVTPMPNSNVTLSVGAATVAVPPKNFPPEALVEGAERCLYGAQTSGGGGFKSIEIY